MKIAHVVDCMEVGGAETVVSQMCRLQREQGHDPSVYAIGSLGQLGQQMRQDGFTVEALLGGNLMKGARNLLRVFRNLRPDAAHFHNPTPTIYGAMAARMAAVPSIISTRHSLVARPRRLAVELKYALAASCCDWIAGICDATVNNIKDIGSIPARKLVRVYNGAVPLRRVPREDCPPKTGFTLLYVGRLAPVKNHPLMLNAFRSALSSMPDLQLWMVGDGPERHNLESMASSLGISANVTFWGQQLDVAPFFSAADAFIMSSRSEGLPISLLQAFSLGVPAIVTEVGGMAEVVRLADAGLTVPAGDSSAMAGAIVRLVGSEAEREQFSAHAAREFQSRFTLEAMTDAYVDLYRSAPRARGRSMVSQ